MKINIDVAKPVLSNKFGGMSGKAIKPIALRNVYTVYDNVDIPIIGVEEFQTLKMLLNFYLLEPGQFRLVLLLWMKV